MAALLQQFGWEYLEHPPYSPDVAPSDILLFGPLKKHLGGYRFQNVVEVQATVLQWFHLQSPEFCSEGTHPLITCCDRCLNLQGNCVEK